MRSAFEPYAKFLSHLAEFNQMTSNSDQMNRVGTCDTLCDIAPRNRGSYLNMLCPGRGQSVFAGRLGPRAPGCAGQFGKSIARVRR